MDIPQERHMGIVEEVKTDARPALPAYAAEDFDKNLPAWAKVVAAGKKSPSELLAMLSTKAVFNEEQKAHILALKKAPEPEPEPEAPPPAGDEWTAAYDAAEEGAK